MHPYGPCQSTFNPYTGVIAIFFTRLLNGEPPVLYEDGEQTRDLCYVGDVARANLLAPSTDKLDGLPVNIGSGRVTTIRRIAEMVSEALDVRVDPVARGVMFSMAKRSTSISSTRSRSKSSGIP